jgi:hypothetical protein
MKNADERFDSGHRPDLMWQLEIMLRETHTNHILGFRLASKNERLSDYNLGSAAPNPNIPQGRNL